MPTLHYLTFDYSEDEDGNASWDALACVLPQRWPALIAEVELLLRWCQRQGDPGALDDGALWDCELQAHSEGPGHAPLELSWQDGQLHGARLLPAALQQHNHPITLALTLSASASFNAALQAHWQLDGDEE